MDAEGFRGERHRNVIPAHVIAVVGVGGGVGTTTVAGLLATRLSDEGSTIVVDLDPRHASLAHALRVYPTHSWLDLGHRPRGEDFDVMLERCRTEVRSGLDLLAGPPQPIGRLDAWSVMSLLQSLSTRADWVVVDFGDLPAADYRAVTAASEIIVVSSQDLVVSRRVPHAVDELERIGQVPVRCVLNSIRRDAGLAPGVLSRALAVTWDAMLLWSSELRRDWNDPGGPGLGAMHFRWANDAKRQLRALVPTSTSNSVPPVVLP